MHTWARFILVLALIVPAARVRSQQSATPSPQTAPADFVADIQPILTQNCVTCHRGGAAPADLRFDSPAALLRGSISGPVILPGNSEESLLIERITATDGVPMPPSGERLSDQAIALIKNWIDAGAKIPEALLTEQDTTPKHWAYVTPTRPALPDVRDESWVRNPIDRFVLARLEKEGLHPSPEASRETLIRRVSLDLTGLPPSPAEVDDFVNDTRADAYERLVDRLLASPRYGERWATPWLDMARYGDSEGWTNDRQRPAWPYRDWVIRALNQNMPFDEFTIEQLAGDMLPNATDSQKIATGFIRSAMLQSEGGTDAEENYWNMLIDRTSTFGSTWLGSSIACAQCHNHKYDPFTQKQFYQFVAFFSNSKFTDEKGDPRLVAAGVNFCCMEPKLELTTPEQEKQLREIRAEIAEYEKRLNESSPEFQKRQAAWEPAVLAFEKEWKPLPSPTLTSSGGTTLQAEADGSILATGDNPPVETYVLEAKAPFERITAIRVEALPDANLPGGGPGRDPYGNFMLQDVKVEVRPTGGASAPVRFKEVLTDNSYAASKKQIWVVDATNASATFDGVKVTTGGERLKFQLLLVPESPIQAGPDGTLRVSIEQTSDVGAKNIGRFRVSATSAANPKFVLDVPALLRPVLSIPPEQRTKDQAEAMTAHYRTVAAELAPVRDRIAELERRIEDLNVPKALIVEEDMSVEHPSAYVHLRGAFVSKGELVKADVPAFLGPLPEGARPNRLGLAKWLVSGDHPLTARVAVNRFWEQMFGRGIVETSEDFGHQATPPTHPELLDWLAVEFVENGWDMKALKRLIVTSSTYRQFSGATSELLDRDPANLLLARGPRFRVEAEMVRDVALATSGLLSAKMYGPPVMPYQPDGLWDGFPGLKLGPDEWEVSPGEDQYRRGLYTFIRRSARYPSLTVFDAPSREFCTVRRNRSNTPLQALTALNDPAFFEAAQAMAGRIVREGGNDASSRAVYGFRLAAAHKPTPSELDTLLSAFSASKQRFDRDAEEAAAVSGGGDAELAAWTMLSNALLNLDETLTKE